MSILAKAQGAACQYILVDSEPLFSNGASSEGRLSDIPMIHISETKSTTPNYTHKLEVFCGL
eukprot:269134-Amphidinium_carterae.1